jgi:hypothetical protein
MSPACTDAENILSFCKTTMIPLAPESLDKGNCTSMIFCAVWDIELVDPPKFELSTLYDTDLKKEGIWVPATITAIIQTAIIAFRRFLRKELYASALKWDSRLPTVGLL